MGDLMFGQGIEIEYPYYGEQYKRCTTSDFDGNGFVDLAIGRYGIYENNLTILFNDGEGNMYTDPLVESDEENIPSSNDKLSNYPNPFNPSTTISYKIANSGNVLIEIFNIKGQKIRTLVDGKYKSGSYSTVWDGINESNIEVSTGIYYCKLKSGNQESVKKLMMLK